MSTTTEVGAGLLSGIRAFFATMTEDFVTAEYAGGCLIANLGAELEGSELLRSSLSSAWAAWRDGVATALREAQEQGTVRADIDELPLTDRGVGGLNVAEYRARRAAE
ncbi:TetR family transcriptional regulator C-terminal domain-containing protein [Nocardia sp. IBHARD005]|uniref:TetR family transcriptional regulator C-terminal domain-containing protein n=1 Tax=Nocardia sp. IBHARD005 TaxID=3457765 RepID=UPI004059ADDC